eukprot:GGOE01006012.1.p1 GENE.GGOE01006012.1~~GGOE01006012.1.p1  ORF type:complete len:413 (-),score=38.14 GGOE01006012.1:838-1968(-)
MQPSGSGHSFEERYPGVWVRKKRHPEMLRHPDRGHLTSIHRHFNTISCEDYAPGCRLVQGPRRDDVGDVSSPHFTSLTPADAQSQDRQPPILSSCSSDQGPDIAFLAPPCPTLALPDPPSCPTSVPADRPGAFVTYALPPSPPVGWAVSTQNPPLGLMPKGEASCSSCGASTQPSSEEGAHDHLADFSQSWLEPPEMPPDVPFADQDRTPAPMPVDPRKYKTKLCRRWEELGSCPYEHTCCFAHGSAELHSLADNHKTLASIGYFSNVMLLAMSNRPKPALPPHWLYQQPVVFQRPQSAKQLQRCAQALPPGVRFPFQHPLPSAIDALKEESRAPVQGPKKRRRRGRRSTGDLCGIPRDGEGEEQSVVEVLATLHK